MKQQQALLQQQEAWKQKELEQQQAIVQQRETLKQKETSDLATRRGIEAGVEAERAGTTP
jgi:hypothetical protein